MGQCVRLSLEVSNDLTGVLLEARLLGLEALAAALPDIHTVVSTEELVDVPLPQVSHVHHQSQAGKGASELQQARGDQAVSVGQDATEPAIEHSEACSLIGEEMALVVR